MSSVYRTVAWRPTPVPAVLSWPARYLGDVLSYALDLTAWIADSDDAIETAYADAMPPDLICGPPVLAGNLVTVQLAGGQSPGGQPGSYTVTVTMVTASGQILQQPVTISTLYADVSSIPLPSSPIHLEPGALWANGLRVLKAPAWAALPTTSLGLPPDTFYANGLEVNLTAGSTILPLTPAGLPPGQIWNNGGVVCFALGSPGIPLTPVGLTSGALWANSLVLTIVP